MKTVRSLCDRSRAIESTFQIVFDFSFLQNGLVAAPGGPLAPILSAGAQALDFDNGAIH
jgi:hypothetical protein